VDHLAASIMNESFLVLFYKKELLFEKRSKNFHSLSAG
jgi:hypothetical protein